MSSEIDYENFAFMNRHAERYVLVRTDRAGVHCGYLVRTNGKGFVSLRESRRLWQWFGAFTLSEVAEDGIDGEKSKLSRVQSEIDLHDAIEIALCSESVERQLKGLRAWNPK